MQFTVLNSEAAVQRIWEQEQQHQKYLNQSVIAQEYIANLPVLFQAADIVEKFRNLTRIIENTWQQIVLALKDPEYNFEFPSITSETFWSHVYRKVCADPGNLNERMTFNRSIVTHFESFDVSRKRPGNGDYEYRLPILDIVQREISRTYASATIIQNITMHLLSINLWIIHLFKSFLLFHQTQNNVQVATMTIAKKAAYKIINHQQFQDLPNEQEIPGLETLYNRIRLIYDADFLETKPDDLSDYENAKMHPMKYLRVSYRLLQEALIQQNWQVKLWSLLPIPSHSIVYFPPINNASIMNGLFVKAQAQNFRIPNFLLSEYDRRLQNFILK